MESLFEALYAYAVENCFALFPFQDSDAKWANEAMVRRAMDTLNAQGMGDTAEQIRDGYSVLDWLDSQCAFWAGLSMGMELSRL